MIRASTMHSPRTMIALLLLGPVMGCGDDLPTPPGMVGSDSTSTGSASTTGGETASTPTSSSSGGPASSDEGGSSSTGHSSVGIPDECTLSEDCPAGELCVAPFDQSAGPEGKGALACVTECVVIMDEDRWCADATACCDPEAECTDRGYCVYPAETDTDTDASSGTSGGGTSSTGG